ncbi:MAG: sigma-54-dependent Fis family transcriptional regulator, partial [Alphaproteobacteria bacterium]|nr:sigma-54-dependent Fis family transcriptional regulator [Alphaproteobacteria bacterium]
AAIPENLLESELFGHEKGAFTGSVARRIGKFEEANGGTLLLDEISEIDIRLQAKLLRAIQEKQITRVGSNDNISLDVRILATSNRELKNEVKAGRFREDLFFRLNVINLQLPKLSERKEDIMDIAKHYAEKYAKSNGIKTPSFSKEAADIIINYEWPGNVRELENTIYRAILLAIDGVVYPESLMLELNQIDKPKTLAEMEKEAIQGTMQKYFGDKNLAANILGISIKILEQKLNEYDLAFEK